MTDADRRDIPDLAADDEVSLLDPAQTVGFADRWEEVQATFVDDPRAAVQQADDLVADVMRALEAGFTDHKSRLEDVWSRGGEVETEDLRVTLQRYRSFFRRLLAA